MIDNLFKDMLATHINTDAHITADNVIVRIDLISIGWLRVWNKELLGVPFTESLLTFSILNLLGNNSARATCVVCEVDAELTYMRCLI